jgi:hypothetical protein
MILLKLLVIILFCCSLLIPSYLTYKFDCEQHAKIDAELSFHDVCRNQFYREMFAGKVDCSGAERRLHTRIEFCAFFLVWNDVRDHYWYFLPVIFFVLFLWWKLSEKKKKKKSSFRNELVPYHR